MTFCEDTEHIYEQVIREIAASYDKEYFWEVRVRLLGTTEQNTSKIAVTELGLPITVEEFRTQFSTMGRQRLNDVGMMKGVHNGCMWCSFYCFCLAYNNLDCLFPDEITIESYPFCFVFGFIAKLDFFFLFITNKILLTLELTCIIYILSSIYVRCITGAARLLKHLHKNKIPFALATSSSKEMAEIKQTNHTALFDLFHHKVMGSSDPEVINGKPAPDIFLVAAKRFPDNPKPENVRYNRILFFIIFYAD